MSTQIFVRSPGSARIEDPQWRGHWAWRGILGLLLAVTIAGCSTDPKQTLITEENQAGLYETISKGNALTYEEAQLLEAYLERNREELEDHKLPPGRTIEELIEEQRLLAILDQSNPEEVDTPPRIRTLSRAEARDLSPRLGKEALRRVPLPRTTRVEEKISRPPVARISPFRPSPRWLSLPLRRRQWSLLERHSRFV